MFKVTTITTGVCIACGKHTECFSVECERPGIQGLLCASDFRKQCKVFAAQADPLRGEQTDATASAATDRAPVG